MIKSESIWSIKFDIVGIESIVGKWASWNWSIENVSLYQPEDKVLFLEQLTHLHQTSTEENRCTTTYCLELELHRDERTDYRFNLSSQHPTLFIPCFEEEELFVPDLVTVSQTNAAQFLDADYQVLSMPMPLPIQAWVEAYIGRHGELLEMGRKKKKGKGRSSGK
ncbi:DUF3305 domain-containing protein [Vibrio sp. SS-MA-C1-2]|nr:DUF3305 domain-containing protein [Vibrio sp. SS-MA-C1-2]UJF20149.1 DUF3305 domain-containing protein [Vibrio sp. SS-MA-C1-2]